MYLNLIEKYNSGSVIEVWNEINTLTNITSRNENFEDIMIILNETMQRVKFNFDLIYSTLKKLNYQFKDESTCFYSTAQENLDKLKAINKEFGFLPLSIIYFYKHISKINFLFQNSNNFNYHYSDPVYIESVSNILEMMQDGSWEETMYENMDDSRPLYLEISPDFYHKDNVSGGIPYGIEITKTQQVDSKLLNTPYGDLFFIDYLRLCFKYGGFPNITKENQNCLEFISLLRSELKPF